MAGQGELVAVGGYLIILGLFGGGLVTWSPAYAFVALATIIFSATVAAKAGTSALSTVPLTGRIALIGVAVLPLLQIVPLPSAIWRNLPSGELRVATLRAAGLADTWQPLSLEPASTALCAVMAVGLVALIANLLRLTDEQFRRVLWLVFGTTLAGIAIGLIQVVTNGSPRLQVIDGGATMLGFFANKNHMALIIACSILLFGLVLNRRRGRAMTIAYTTLAIVGIVTTNSRAGLLLGGIAAIVVFFDSTRDVKLRWRVAAVTIIAALGLGLLSTAAFELVSGRIGDIGSDGRWKILPWSLPLARDFALLGSGFGSYATLFATREQLEWLGPTYINAVHNDYVQLIIEAGIAGVALLMLLIWSVLSCIPYYRAMPLRDPQRAVTRMGFIVVLLFALHSGFDYPLRRPATWPFFALALVSIYRGFALRTPRHSPSESVELA